MKKFFGVMIGAALAVAVMAPQALAVEVSGDAYLGVFDKYLWRGIDLSGSQPVAQGGVDVSAGGFTVSYWTNVQLSHSTEGDIDLDGDGAADIKVWDHDEATETDIVLDYTFDVNELLSVSVGDIYYTFNVPGSTHELYVGASLDTLLAPSFTIYYDWDAANDKTHDSDGDDLGDDDYNGFYYAASVGHTLELAEKLGLNLGAAVTYNDQSPFVGHYTNWHNYELSVSADYALTEQVSLTPSLLYSSGISDQAKVAIDSEALAGLTVTFSF